MVAGYALEKGRQYDLKIELYEPRGNATIKLVWDAGADTSWREKINEAVDAIGAANSTTVSFTIKITGPRDGEEVVQLYIQDALASVARPVQGLKGFQRVHLKAGEAKTVLADE